MLSFREGREVGKHTAVDSFSPHGSLLNTCRVLGAKMIELRYHPGLPGVELHKAAHSGSL